MSDTATNGPELIAELNDLLQLDHDAVQAYSVAIDNLENESYRETLRRFRADHERHVAELTNLIQARGGKPVNAAHIPSGFFKLALQQVGRAGGDRGILLAFEANERQVREKYRRHADRPHDPAVQPVLRRAAEDEDRHYAWAMEALRRAGLGADTPAGGAAERLGEAYGRAADLAEKAERKVREQLADEEPPRKEPPG